jgi:hypothetical protein
MILESFTLVLAAGFLAGSGAPDADSARRHTPGCATASLRQVIGEERWSSPGAMRGVLPCDHTPVGPPPSPTVGSSWNWYLIYQYGAQLAPVAAPAPIPPPSLSIAVLGSEKGEPSFAIGIPERTRGRDLRLLIFDVSGRLVRELARSQAVPGTHRVRWDGRDEVGRSSAAGVYFLRLSVGDEHATARATIFR